MAAVRILGVDTSLRSTGAAVVEANGNSLTAVDGRRLKMSRTWLVSRCLLELRDGISAMIEATQPEAVSIEGIFFSKNARTAMVLGQARGVVIATAAGAGLPVFEYAPRRVKQAVVGYGTASKEQVSTMVMRMLKLPELPQVVVGDAYEMAICHLHNRTGYAATENKPL
jgi:crossover junction endodeoxyribonuclease RuvC